MNKTYSAKLSDVQHDWLLIDATDKPLGRLASEVAKRLRGKHKPQFTPHVDTGDYVIVTNAEKVALTGNKRLSKIYYRHSGRVGNLKSISFEEMQAKHPERVIELAVKGMMPKNPLGRAMLRKLRVYVGENNQHQAQNYKLLEI